MSTLVALTGEEAALDVVVGVLRLLFRPFGGLSPTSVDSRLRLMEVTDCAVLRSSVVLFTLFALALLLESCTGAETPLGIATAGEAIFGP